jgi:ergothioneine biosynthesis protein EgtB
MTLGPNAFSKAASVETILMSQPLASHASRQSLRQRYFEVRAYSVELTSGLSSEDALVQSMPDASPAKWHLAHTTWFFETVVLANDPSYKIFSPAFGHLFNSYYNAVGPRHPRPQRGLITRPSLQDVLAYREHVDRAMSEFIDGYEAVDHIVLGLNHEEQHQELLLTDIKHAFFQNPILPSFGWEEPAAPQTNSPQWSRQPGGIVEIGASSNAIFAFDNERPRHQVLVKPYRIATNVITNGEFAAFIDDGGYRRPEFWLSDGWTTVQSEGWRAPLYWDGDGSGDWTVFTLAGPRPLNHAAPVQHVSFYEAAAFAAWAGKRLPTEFEWEAASADFPHGAVWEWTRSSYDPYPGFKAFDGVVAEYNGKFMVGQLVLRGGSTATPRDHARPSYRNFFPPHARWQFSGIRLAEDCE